MINSRSTARPSAAIVWTARRTAFALALSTPYFLSCDDYLCDPDVIASLTANWPQAQHGYRSADWDVGVGDGLPGRRQHIGQIDEPRIRRPFRNFDVGELGLWDAQQFGLAAGNFAVELRKNKFYISYKLLVK